MKTSLASTMVLLIVLILGCSKDNEIVQTYTIPNGDFEIWSGQSPDSWKTNNCPMCAIPLNIFVQQNSSSYSALSAAKFIYNGAFPSLAENKFPVAGHPSFLTAYVKSNMVAMDSVFIKIELYSNSVVVDGGQWIGTSSIANYTQINIPITQNNSNADSALIRIQGGNKTAFPFARSDFWVDNLSLQ